MCYRLGCEKKQNGELIKGCGFISIKKIVWYTQKGTKLITPLFLYSKEYRYIKY